SDLSGRQRLGRAAQSTGEVLHRQRLGPQGAAIHGVDEGRREADGLQALGDGGAPVGARAQVDDEDRIRPHSSTSICDGYVVQGSSRTTPFAVPTRARSARSRNRPWSTTPVTLFSAS